MKPDCKFYERLLKQKYKEQYSYFEEFRDSIMELIEQAFQEGLNACPECAVREQDRFDSEEGMRTAWEIIDG